MDEFKRFAIYHLPEPGPLAEFGAAWLGWDVETGTPRPHPVLPDLPAPVAEITATPRKYGFHGTVKPPFRLAEGTGPAALDAATQALARRLAPVTIGRLAPTRIGPFLALVPEGGTTTLGDLAAETVRALDGFRAPLAPEDRAQRRPERLSARQVALLDRWGYPYVMEEFRFHFTLTGPLPRATLDTVLETLRPHLAPLLPTPYIFGSLSLAGELPDGRFRQIRRYPLGA